MHPPYLLDETAMRYVSLGEALAREVLAPHASAVDAAAAFPRESMAALAAQGMFGLCLPREVGGEGQGPRTFAAVVEVLAKACASTAMVYVMHTTAAQLLAAAPSGRTTKLLQEIVAGRHLTTLALSEVGGRSLFWAPLSELRPQGAGYTYQAKKSWVTAAEEADSYVACARVPGAASALESVLLLVERRAPGVRVTGRFEGLGLRGNGSAPVAVEVAQVPQEALLTSLGGGAQALVTQVLPWFCAGTAAMSNGLCSAAVEATATHLQQAGFAQDGTHLRDLPNLRARLAQMSIRTEQARALLGAAVSTFAPPAPAPLLPLLQARLASIEAAVEVSDLAMKACGGAAFSRHLPVERIFRDARAGWVMAPTADHLQDFVGRLLTGLPLL
jgi:alkylation response protein AidB-like acyl-CoA dehydrogenase